MAAEELRGPKMSSPTSKSPPPMLLISQLHRIIISAREPKERPNTKTRPENIAFFQHHAYWVIDSMPSGGYIIRKYHSRLDDIRGCNRCKPYGIQGVESPSMAAFIRPIKKGVVVQAIVTKPTIFAVST